MDSHQNDPHRVLGVELDATPDEIRQNYLKLVRQFPPDHNAEKFHEIHGAYQMLIDPLVRAKAILNPGGFPPDLIQIIDESRKERIRLAKLALLSLGNFE